MCIRDRPARCLKRIDGPKGRVHGVIRKVVHQNDRAGSRPAQDARKDGVTLMHLSLIHIFREGV